MGPDVIVIEDSVLRNSLINEELPIQCHRRNTKGK
jgi:hypothetical protein